MAKPKIIYFITTSKPTNYDRQRASTMNAAVSFRNVNLVKSGDPAEACDGVAGVVIPQQYQHKPDAKTVLTASSAYEASTGSAPVFGQE